MSRINIYSTPDPEEAYDVEPVHEGWYDPEKATSYPEGTRWDGSNRVGVVTGSQWIDAILYRTVGGRWVERIDATRCHSGPDQSRFLTEEEARGWMIRAEHEPSDVERAGLGPVEPESGPGGRPPVGRQVVARMSDDLIARIDAAALITGATRADWIRAACDAALREA